MAKAPTLKDVALRSGVSTATVRRVLYLNGYVAEETRQTVHAAIAETGYRVNVIARGLRRRRTLTIGHIVHSIVPNPFFAAVAFGAEREALAHGCNVLMYNVHGDPAEERSGVEALAERRVDAILFTVAIDAANVQLACDAEIPVVQVERMPLAKTHGVTVDNYVGSVSAMKHLIGLGHRRIAFIGSDPAPRPERSTIVRQTVVEEERLAGYLDMLRSAELPVDDRLIALVGGYEVDQGFAATERFLALSAPPTAIFAAADTVAAGVLQALYKAQLRVPDDISVVGFDDTIASHLTPPLTTVAQPMIAMGEVAVRIAIHSLQTSESAWRTPQVERLGTELVVRQSTGPVSQQA